LRGAEQKQSPKFTQELRELRLKEGMTARFEASFAGNPRPIITWFYNGEELANSKSAQIRTKGDKTTLTLIDCTESMSGYYMCKLQNDLGSDMTRAGLTISSE
jgi:hypothetical protein